MKPNGIVMCHFNSSDPTVKTFDHINATDKGGINSMSNLIVMCLGCNRVKARRTASEWLQHMAANGKKDHIGTTLAAWEAVGCPIQAIPVYDPDQQNLFPPEAA